MNRRTFLGAAAAPFLVMTGCTSADVSTTLGIISGVLVAGETLIPILQNGGAVTPTQGVQIATYVNGASQLATIILAGLQAGSMPMGPVNVQTQRLIRQHGAIGTLPRRVDEQVLIISNGTENITKLLYSPGQRVAVALDTSRGQGRIVTPHISMMTAPMTCIRMNRLHARAAKLSGKAEKLI